MVSEPVHMCLKTERIVVGPIDVFAESVHVDDTQEVYRKVLGCDLAADLDIAAARYVSRGTKFLIQTVGRGDHSLVGKHQMGTHIVFGFCEPDNVFLKGYVLDV